MRSGREIILAILLSFSLSACGGTEATLTVSAAANLESAFGEVSRAFEKQTGSRVTYNFGSTGQLAQQIAQGAPVDVFVAADRATIDDLAARGFLLPDSVHLYARGEIVLYVRASSTISFKGLEDLTRPEIRRIAIANPDRAPYGRAAIQALERQGIWNVVRERLVLTENIQQTKQYVDTGNVDAAITARSLIFGAPGIWVSIPKDLYTPIEQALGIVKGTRNPREARAFGDFLLGEQGRTILARYGYGLPGGN